ncbi:MAG: hypothetical protein IJE89_01040 [Bacilli bacterium]|nr:hypothetical protein [Bacilli bacterium]
MIGIKNKVYRKSLFYAISIVVCSVLTYLFLDSGFNTKTKIYVNYENNSNIYYKVKYIDDSFDYVNMNKYASNMIDYIEVNYQYNNVLSEYVSGYYKYNVMAYLITYEEDITNSLWEREYNLVNNKIILLDENNINNIKIDDSFRINYIKYKNEIEEFINTYNIDVSGYLHIRINILEFLNFDSLEKEYADNKVISLNIPLTKDFVDIDTNNINDIDSYYEFSDKTTMNVVFILIGLFCFSLSMTFFVMVIRQFIFIYKNETEYNKLLKKILSKYDNDIVKVKRFNVSKKYNIIYVCSFDELLDVHNKIRNIIGFKELVINSRSVFFITDKDTIWVYELNSNKVN